MGIVESIFRRVVMTILFSLALLTTFESISGVSAQQYTNWWFFDQDPFSNSIDRKITETSIKKYSMRPKVLPFLSNEKKVMSHEVVETAPVSLEEAIDWSKYPSTRVVATGYTAGIESTGKKPGHPQYGITYSGVKVKRDLYSTIAADPKTFPIGSILFIPGYGYGVVADTGSAIKGNKIDLYYDTVKDVYEQWGRKEVEVYIVKKGTGRLTEAELVSLNEAEAVQVFRRQLSFAK